MSTPKTCKILTNFLVFDSEVRESKITTNIKTLYTTIVKISTNCINSEETHFSDEASLLRKEDQIVLAHISIACISFFHGSHQDTKESLPRIFDLRAPNITMEAFVIKLVQGMTKSQASDVEKARIDTSHVVKAANISQVIFNFG